MQLLSKLLPDGQNLMSCWCGNLISKLEEKKGFCLEGEKKAEKQNNNYYSASSPLITWFQIPVEHLSEPQLLEPQLQVLHSLQSLIFRALLVLLSGGVYSSSYLPIIIAVCLVYTL